MRCGDRRWHHCFYNWINRKYLRNSKLLFVVEDDQNEVLDRMTMGRDIERINVREATIAVSIWSFLFQNFDDLVIVLLKSKKKNFKRGKSVKCDFELNGNWRFFLNSPIWISGGRRFEIHLINLWRKSDKRWWSTRQWIFCNCFHFTRLDKWKKKDLRRQFLLYDPASFKGFYILHSSLFFLIRFFFHFIDLHQEKIFFFSKELFCFQSIWLDCLFSLLFENKRHLFSHCN